MLEDFQKKPVLYLTKEKTELHAVTTFLHMKGLKGEDIAEEMKSVLGESASHRQPASSYVTVKHWLAVFKCGRMSTKDELKKCHSDKNGHQNPRYDIER